MAATDNATTDDTATDNSVAVRRPGRPGRRRRSTGAAWLLLPPGLLLLVGALGPFVVTVATAVSAHGVTGIVTAPLSDEIVARSIWRTLALCVAVTGVSWLLGLVFSLAVAMSPPRLGRALFGLLFLTFWISLLVRTYAWVLTLQPRGALDVVGSWLGLTDTGFGLFQTVPGLLPSMVHIMVPYMVLPMYAALRAVDPAQLKAARSLGASEWLTLRSVVLPAVRDGSWAGIVLVFLLSLGFYVTPSFLGGPGSQVVAVVLGLQLGRLQDPGMTAALGTLMLVTVLVLYAAAERIFRISGRWEQL